jgi:hypothetical protein
MHKQTFERWRRIHDAADALDQRSAQVCGTTGPSNITPRIMSPEVALS